MDHTSTLRIFLMTTLAVAMTTARPQTPVAAPMFGTNGGLPVNILTGEDVAIRHALLPDGKLLLGGGGYDINCNCYHISLVKLDTLCGKLDANFGNGGKIGHIFDQRSTMTDMVALPNGKILACGQNAPSNSSSQHVGAVYRFNTDGSPDLTMNGTGWRVDRFDAVSSGIHGAIVPLNNGRFYAVGSSESNINGGAMGMGAMRYLEDGSLDASYSGDGKVWTNFGGGPSSLAVHAAMVLSDSSLFVVGSASSAFGEPLQMILARFDAEGNLYPDFGSGGLVLTNIILYSSWPQMQAVLLADGKVLVSASGNTTAQEFLTARFLPTGALDTSYGTNGLSAANPSPNTEFAYGLEVLADGSSIQTGTYAGSYMVKRDPDGQLDPGFGNSGVFHIPQVTVNMVIRRSLAMGSGRMMAYGSNGGEDMMAVKLTTEPALGLFADLGPDTSGCVSLVLEAGFPGSSFLWSNNTTEHSLVVSNSGTYRVAITNEDGCTDRDTISVVIGQFPAVPEIYQQGIYLLTNSIEDMQWYLNGEIIPGANGYDWTPSVDGSYMVAATNFAGCTSFSEPFAVITTAVSERTGPERKVFPNPATDHVYVQLPANGSAGIQRVSLIDPAGRQVAQLSIEVGVGKPQRIDLSQVVPGCYLLKFEGEQEPSMKAIHILKY